MEGLVLKFKDVEEDHMVVYHALKEQRFKNDEITHEIWSQLMGEAYVPLVEGYIIANKIDEVSDYVLEQWDNGTHGFHLFALISDALTSKREIEKLIKFWESIVLSRHLIEHKHAVTEALKLMRQALLALGDVTTVDKLEARLEKKRPLQKKKSNKQISSAMTEAEFWKLIELAKEPGSRTYAKTLLRADNLKSLLLNLRVSEVQQFAEIYQQKMNDSYSWELWAVASIAFGGCSDDNFDYFRAWLISEGREVYEQLTRDPETIINLGGKPIQLESILYIPSKVYSELTGNKLVVVTQPVDTPSGSDWDESKEVLQQRFPRAYKFYNN